MAHAKEHERFSLMVPRMFDMFAISKFLSDAYKDDDKYWWCFVPDKLTSPTSEWARYMNLLIDNGHFNVLLNQMTYRAGLEEFGELAVRAMIKELLHNLHGKDVIEGKHFHELTSEQRKQALRAIGLIK